MSVNPAAGLNVRNCRKVAALEVFVEVFGVLQVCGADGGVGHDIGFVLKWIADVAVLIALGADGAVVDLVFIAEVGVPLIAVILPRNTGGHQHVGDGVLLGGRNGERRVGDVVIGVGVGAVAEVAGIVVVEQIVVARIALGIYFVWQADQVFQDRADAGTVGMGALAARAAA